MGRACHAEVAISHIKKAQIAHTPISKLFPYVHKWSCRRAVLRLCSMEDACGESPCSKTSGASSLQWDFIWPDSSWGQIWGKEFSSWGKPAVISKLSSIGCNVLGSARALSAAMAAFTISFEVVVASRPCLALL